MNPETSAGPRLVDRLARDPRLDTLADAVQPVVDAATAADGATGKVASSLLHGTWLGHPLHPLLTDVPIGAWTVGAIADVLALGGNASAAAAGDIATTVGVAGAVGAALAGWADWSDTKDDPRRLGIAHAALNVTALTAYVTSLALRRAGRRPAATLAALTGYAIMGVGAYLGGELTLGQQLGVRHIAIPIEPFDGFVEASKLADVPATGTLRADVNGIPILLASVDGTIRAVSAVCTHRGAPLDQGTRDGACITCPWHGSRFALADGTIESGPATFPLASFDTRVSNGVVELRLRRSA